jgi:hypothetical protein
MDIVTKEIAIKNCAKFFYTGTECSKGHLSERYVSTGHCYQCQRDHYGKNQTRYLEEGRKRNEKNKDRNSANCKEYYKKNSEEIKRKVREYAAKNVEKIKEYHRNYIKTPAGKAGLVRRNKKIMCNKPWLIMARTLIHSVLRRTGRRKTSRRTDVVGYDEDKLRQRIEMNFKEGMSWDNYGEWHVDHTKPVNAFVINGVTDLKLINSLCNLKPMWAADNIRKKDIWPYTKS